MKTTNEMIKTTMIRTTTMIELSTATMVELVRERGTGLAPSRPCPPFYGKDPTGGHSRTTQQQAAISWSLVTAQAAQGGKRKRPGEDDSLLFPCYRYTSCLRTSRPCWLAVATCWRQPDSGPKKPLPLKKPQHTSSKPPSA